MFTDLLYRGSQQSCNNTAWKGKHASGSQYLVPESLSVQGDDDHGGVGEEALVVERQIFSFPRHIQHVPTSHRDIKS